MECVFCKIINKELPAKIVYEDAEIIAIVPLEEISEGHTLLLPKKHFKDVFDIEDNSLVNLAKVMKKISLSLVEENNATGINILNANGKDAQQSVFHIHFHLVPRYPNDGLDMWIKQNL